MVVSKKKFNFFYSYLAEYDNDDLNRNKNYSKLYIIEPRTFVHYDVISVLKKMIFSCSIMHLKN